MFANNKKPGFVSELSKEQNRISSGTVITGDITAKGGFRIEGTLKGNLITMGKVVISKGGVMEGDLTCQNADFEGKFSGKLKVQETFTVRSSAVIEGEVITSKLSIEPGAAFNASCVMKSNMKTLKNEPKKEERTA